MNDRLNLINLTRLLFHKVNFSLVIDEEDYHSVDHKEHACGKIGGN